MKKIFFTALLLTLLLNACEGGNQPASTPTIEPASNSQTESSPVATEPAIVHTLIPVDLPANASGQASDHNSSLTADKKTAPGGDRFTFQHFERPFNANSMDVYLPQIDIVETSVHQDETWVYASLTVQGTDSSGNLNGRYAIEIDTDLNGKGDWLILVSNPSSTEWTVTDVQLYQDANKDVGGASAMFADENVAAGDGFETLSFDAGLGDDPDAAWVRISPAAPTTIEFAVKLAAIGSPQSFMVGMWAGNALLDPALFDINDRFTHEQAGASDATLEYFYPLKEVFELDNSCRMAVGFAPNGSEPGICELYSNANQDSSSSGTGGSSSSGGSGNFLGPGNLCNLNPDDCYYPLNCTCIVSDIRLKTDIVLFGKAENGLPLYTFRYIGGTAVYQGVMAQDVLKFMPEAVIYMPNGYMAVNYDMLGLTMERVK